MTHNKTIIRFVLFVFILFTLLACNIPSVLIPASLKQTPAAPTAGVNPMEVAPIVTLGPVATPLNQVLAPPFTLTIAPNQLTISWAPAEISFLLSNNLLIGGFLFFKTGIFNADGSEQVEVTAVNIADSAGNFPNNGSVTLTDLKSGDYILQISGTSETLQMTKLAEAEFTIP